MNDALHPIQLVARLTGLSTYVIRIWEQRYSAVEPRRTGSNRRLYSQADIDRLSLLRDLTQSGHSIGQVARLPMDKLKELAAESPVPGASAATSRPETGVDERMIGSCISAIDALDSNSLGEALRLGARRFGAQGVLHKVVSPLVNIVGDRWRDGSLSAAGEHFASSAVRDFLTGLARPFGGDSVAPAVVAATPAGQLHELGVHLVCAVAANLGWRVVNLGASLPALEIAGAADTARARVVALSIVYPVDDPDLPDQLRTLRSSLSQGVALIAGGRAARAYESVLDEIGAEIVDDLGELGAVLDRLRLPQDAAAG